MYKNQWAIPGRHCPLFKIWIKKIRLKEVVNKSKKLKRVNLMHNFCMKALIALKNSLFYWMELFPNLRYIVKTKVANKWLLGMKE